MKDSLEALAAHAGGTDNGSRNYESPPLHLWNPELSGDIAIVIDAKGDWYHEGTKIARDSLVRLFASILRREEDGEYYLVTPAEKWRIAVERHALTITDFEMSTPDGQPTVLAATLNTGQRLTVSDQYPLFTDQEAGGIAGLLLPHGLSALCTRAAWYRLVELAELQNGCVVLKSGDYEFHMSGT